MESVLPLWCWTAVALTALCPATLMYDLVWQLVERRRFGRYALEAGCDAVCVFLAMLLAHALGAPGHGVAMAGCCGGVLSKLVALAVTGTEGFFAEAPQVPEWWVALSVCFIAPLMGFEVLAPLFTYLWIFGSIG